MKAIHSSSLHESSGPETIFSGNIFIFHSFDIGDDINLEKIEQTNTVTTRTLIQPKYFKQYHTPLAIELPESPEGSTNISCKLHNFGAISLTYKIPFTDTLENIRKEFNTINNYYHNQSIIDVKSIFKKIEPHTTQPKFFQTRSSYLVLQVNPTPEHSVQELRERCGSIIASTLRFEIETLSEEQKDEILKDAIGYFRGDLIIIDTDAAFIYDKTYEEILDFFEFANIQQLELRYFDHLLDLQLNKIYEGKVNKPPLRAYLPFVSSTPQDPIEELGKLKVGVSVITERLEGSIKTAGEPYFSELYALLVEKLDLISWRNAIDRKLSIIHDVQSTYQRKVDIIHEDILSVLVIILIFIEIIVGIMGHMR